MTHSALHHLKSHFPGLEFECRDFGRYADSQAFVAQVPSGGCRFSKRVNDKGLLYDNVIANVEMATFDSNRSFYSVIGTDNIEMQKGYDLSYDQPHQVRVYEMVHDDYFGTNTVAKKYKSITKTDRRLGHAIDSADVFTVDGKALKLVFEMEHGVLYGYDEECGDEVEQTIDGRTMRDRAKLEHARNGRMIVTGVCGILCPRTPLLPDDAPGSPRW